MLLDGLSGGGAGKPTQHQIIGAHILRVEELSRRSTEGLSGIEKEKVEARNRRNKERLKKALIDKIIVKPEKALEAEVRTLQNMYGRDLSKNEVIEKFLDTQRQKLETWIDYLDGGSGAEIYPTWFKIYAMDGVENMGRYNAEKGIYEKRSSGTISEFPELNPAALAKTFDVVNNFYSKNNKPKEEKELDLYKSGSFNRIYSKSKSEVTFSIEIPEWFDSVKGVWREYTPDMKEELMAAAQGTSWCVSGAYSADQYLGRDGAKFYLFHLEDIETGVMSETAAASIRMEDGEVAEISGVRSDSNQSIDISLLPTVIEKLRQLPGGEDYSDKLSYSLELIENFSDNAKRKGLKDALKELGAGIDEKVYFDEGSIIINNLEELKKHFSLEEILENVRIRSVDAYLKAGFDVEDLFSKVGNYGLEGFKSFIKKGVDKNSAFEKVDNIFNYEIKDFISAGIPIEKVANRFECAEVRDFNTFIKLGLTKEATLENIGGLDSFGYQRFIEEGFSKEEIFNKIQEIPSYRFDEFVDEGFGLMDVFNKVKSIDDSEFEFFYSIGFHPQDIFSKIELIDYKYFEQFVETGLSRNKVFEKIKHVRSANFKDFVNAGFSPECVFEKVFSINVNSFVYFVEAGIPAKDVFEKANDGWGSGFNHEYCHIFINSGIPEEEVFNRTRDKDDFIYDFRGFLDQGFTPQFLFSKISTTEHYYFSEFVEYGLDPQEVFNKLEHEGDWCGYYRRIVNAGISPEQVFSKMSVVKPYIVGSLINDGLDPREIFKKMSESVLSRDYKDFVDSGLSPQVVFDNVEEIDKNFLHDFIGSGISPELAFSKVPEKERSDASNFSLFVEAGMDPRFVFGGIKTFDSVYFKSFVDAGIPAEEAFEKVKYTYGYKSFSDFVTAGVPIQDAFKKVRDINIRGALHSINSEEVMELFKRYVDAGLSPEEVFLKLEEMDEDLLGSLISAGVPPKVAFDRLKKDDGIKSLYYDYYVRSGVDPGYVFENIDTLKPYEIARFIERGFSYDQVFKKINYEVGRLGFLELVHNGINPEDAFNKIGASKIREDDRRTYIAEGVPEDIVDRRLREVAVDSVAN